MELSKPFASGKVGHAFGWRRFLFIQTYRHYLIEWIGWRADFSDGLNIFQQSLTWRPCNLSSKLDNLSSKASWRVDISDTISYTVFDVWNEEKPCLYQTSAFWMTSYLGFRKDHSMSRSFFLSLCEWWKVYVRRERLAIASMQGYVNRTSFALISWSPAITSKHRINPFEIIASDRGTHAFEGFEIAPQRQWQKIYLFYEQPLVTAPTTHLCHIGYCVGVVH